MKRKYAAFCFDLKHSEPCPMLPEPCPACIRYCGVGNWENSELNRKRTKEWRARVLKGVKHANS